MISNYDLELTQLKRNLSFLPYKILNAFLLLVFKSCIAAKCDYDPFLSDIPFSVIKKLCTVKKEEISTERITWLYKS